MDKLIELSRNLRKASEQLNHAEAQERKACDDLHERRKTLDDARKVFDEARNAMMSFHGAD